MNGLEEDESLSASEEVGGAENRSEVVVGRRQRGQEDLVCFRVFKIQAWQKIWPQRVITISVGGVMQIGQSKSSPSCSTSTIF
uniref:Uncharacterized protein n=1 Tax=Cannabis sativa TaxID=3483 RepID=A0A803RA24_CANSA